MARWETMTEQEIEELRFRRNMERSHEAVLAVGEYLKQQGFSIEIPPLRIRPDFKNRHSYNDLGRDIIIVGKGKVEVKRRGFDFTCAADFPYRYLNVDRVSKQKELALMYFSTNYELTHAAVIDGQTKPKWTIEKTPDPKRQYTPYDVFRCSLEYVNFVQLPPLPKSSQPSVSTGPDLQEWIRKHGSYCAIDWRAWDAAVAQWRNKLEA